MLVKPLAARTYHSIFNSFRVIRCLSQCVSSKIAIFTTFLFPLETPLGQSCCMDEKRIRCLQIVSQHVPIYVHCSTVSQLFEPQVPKIAVFTYRSPHFCFPWRRLGDYHAICCMDGKTIQCLPNSSQHVPIYLQQFPSYTMLHSMRKSKNRYFYHIFCFPWGRPWGNHAKCCMNGKKIRCLQIVSLVCPSTYNRL